jgi:hypothetical protein
MRSRKTTMKPRLAPLLLALAMPGGCAAWDWQGAEDYYAYVSALSPASEPLRPPEGRQVSVCSGYSCRFRTPVLLTDADLALARSELSRASDASGERAAVRAAVADLETKVGRLTGTGEDVGSFHVAGAGDPSQQDCIDETANTTSYLLVLEREALLRFHSVREPALRGTLIDGRWPHFSAVLRESVTSEDFVVDSWPRDNGELPDVIPLDEWLLQ